MSFQTVYLLNYNNYYNRKIKIEGNTINDYWDYLCANPSIPTMASNPITANFSPNDGVNTEIISNWSGDIPDYVIVTEEGSADITSRWFVIDAVRERGGQFRMSLARDLIADHWDDLLEAPIFVQKGMLPTDDKFIFNPEAGSFNQIKKETYELYDASGCPWIVGYIPKDIAKDDNVTVTSKGFYEPEPDFVVDGDISNWRYYDFINKRAFSRSNSVFSTEIYIDGPQSLGCQYFKFNENKVVLLESDPLRTRTYDGFFRHHGQVLISKETAQLIREKIVNTSGLAYRNAFYNELTYNQSITSINYQDLILLRAYNNKIIKTNDQYYRVRVETGNTKEEQFLSKDNDLVKSIVEGFPWGQTINGVQWFTGLMDSNHNSLSKPTDKTVKLHVEGDYVKIILEDLSQAYPLNGIIPQARTHCSDMPFDIFCMPYSDDVSIVDGNTSIKSNIQINMSFAQGVALSIGADSIYDVQILPFCPFPNIITGHKIINGNISSSNITQNSEVVGKIFWCPYSQLSFNIDILYPSETEAISKKVLTQTQFARIVAPNQSSFFDFNIQKNNGLSNIQVYCTFKPFTPWMKIVPQWNVDGLYSTPNQLYDARGLLLAGDYSVAQATSAWANYELNNKNYLSIFDRQIQSMELNRNLELVGEGFGALAGTIAGTGAGFMIGGPIGAAIGTITGAAAGIGDFAIELQKQNEAIDYTKDLFEYQLGNIKALPQGLARTAAQNICNSYVPILEIWDTTEEEKLALSNKIKYNGMTVQRIDKLINYLPQSGFFQGQLIRLESVKDDFHIVNALAKEIRLGFYLPDVIGE